MTSKVSVAVILALGLVGLGCARTMPAPRSARATALLVGARHEGMTLEDPMVLDEDAVATVRDAVGLHGLPSERITRLMHHLHDGERRFRHAPGLTVPASRALRERRGDCMTHAVLFVSLARRLGIEAFFVHAKVARQYLEKGNTLVATTHVAVGYRQGAMSYVVDVWNTVPEWRLAYYVPIDDAAALALYHSNLAIDALLSGRVAEAERLLRYLQGQAPDVEELPNNLAVSLLRQKRYDDALAVLQAAIARFPEYEPLYTNAYLAALGAGQLALAQSFEAKGRDVAHHDPIFAFARGVTRYEGADYEGAADAFETALAAQSESIVVYAWLVRAYLAAGHRDKGLEAFERARRLAPQDGRIKALVEMFPDVLRERLEEHHGR